MLQRSRAGLCFCISFCFFSCFFSGVSGRRSVSGRRNTSKQVVAQKKKRRERRLRISFLSRRYRTRQGRTVRAQIKVNKPAIGAQVKFLSKTYQCHPHPTKAFVYEAYIPIECEGKTGRQRLVGRVKDRNGKFSYCKSVIDIRKVKFAFEQKLQRASARLRRKVAREGKGCKKTGFLHSESFTKLLAKSPKRPMWKGAFGLPTKVLRYTTPFGEIRNHHKWGRYLHKAVDIVGPYKHPVWASHDGKVVVKDRFPYSGKTVVLDHGVGVFTHYYHLNSYGRINVGSRVKKGTLIGRIGNTGRSTGPHLHWGLSIGQEFVDPVEWTTKMFF